MLRCDSAIATLPAGRRGLPLLLTVARLNRVKGIPALVEAWAGDPRLLESFNLAIVGGELEHPTPEERHVIDEIDAVCARLPQARSGLVALGHRPHDEVPQLLRAAAHGIPGLVAAGDLATGIAAYYQGLSSVRKNGMYPDTRRYVVNVQTLMNRYR